MHIILIGNYPNDKQESMLRFSNMLHEGLLKRDIECTYLAPEIKLGKLKQSTQGIGKWLGHADKMCLFPKKIKEAHSKNPKALVHICDHSNAFYTKLLDNVPNLVTCNDVLAIKSSLGHFPKNPVRFSGRVLQGLIMRGLQRAQAITCISKKTQQDLINTLNIPEEKTSVTYMGLNYPYTPMDESKARSRIKELVPQLQGIIPPYILHVGSDAWYKNRTGVLHIYQALKTSTRSEDRMVFVGPPPNRLMQALIKNYKISDRVFFIEKASSEDLRALYSQAELLLHPSFEEGFGWPILEALACGCRVATTNRAPMTEVGGTAARYIPVLKSEKTEDIVTWAHNCAAHIAEMIAQDPDERNKACKTGIDQAAKFSTDAMIDNYIGLYQRTLSS